MLDDLRQAGWTITESERGHTLDACFDMGIFVTITI